MHPTTVEFLAEDRLADQRREARQQAPLARAGSVGRTAPLTTAARRWGAIALDRAWGLLHRPVRLAGPRLRHP